MKRIMLLVALCLTCSVPKGITIEGKIVTAGSPCERACKVLEHYECIEAKPNAVGKTCVQVCAQVVDAGYASLPLDCIIEAQSATQLVGVCDVCK